MTEDDDPLDPVFVVPAGLRALSVLILGPLAGFALVCPWFLTGSRSDLGLRVCLILGGAACAAALAWGICSAFRSRLEFLPKGIRLTKGLGPPLEIPSDEIEGYRVLPGRRRDQALKIFFKDAARSPIRIDMSFGRQEELVALLEDRYTNLDDVDSKAEMKQILSDPELGANEEAREAALQRAKLQVGVLNTATALSVFWVMLYPRPYSLAIAVLAALPIIGACLVHFSRGAVALDGKRNSVRPVVGYALLGPSMVLGFRAFLDWHILGWSGFWMPFAVLAGILVGFLLMVWLGDAQRRAGTVFVLCLVAVAESYGLVLFLNCRLDHSVPAIHRAEVLSRRISRGRRSTTYYLTVRPWIDGDYSREVTVPGSTYGWHREGSTVLIGVRPGALSMPWYFVQ
jgi:hypothetical protein